MDDDDNDENEDGERALCMSVSVVSFFCGTVTGIEGRGRVKGGGNAGGAGSALGELACR